MYMMTENYSLELVKLIHVSGRSVVVDCTESEVVMDCPSKEEAEQVVGELYIALVEDKGLVLHETNFKYVVPTKN